MIFTCVVNHFYHCWDTLNGSPSFIFFFPLNLTPVGCFEVIINTAWISRKEWNFSLFLSFSTLQIIQSAAILHENSLLQFITPPSPSSHRSLFADRCTVCHLIARKVFVYCQPCFTTSSGCGLSVALTQQLTEHLKCCSPSKFSAIHQWMVLEV
jgi:hypothetical protein